jgi:hypothetical protein
VAVIKFQGREKIITTGEERSVMGSGVLSHHDLFRKLTIRIRSFGSRCSKDG